MKENKAILKIIKKVGTIQKVADEVGVSRPYVSHWLHNRRKIPPELIKKLVKLSNNEVAKKDLRPDLYDIE